VLLADDEAQVRSLVMRILERAGHSVIPAADGDEAVRQFAAHRDQIDLAVLDVMMPGLTGPEVLLRLRESAPDLPALFITGESFGLLDQANAPVLKKPFPASRLLDAIAAAMEQSAVAVG
jgi:CheY-like chemotaxis protein